MTHNTSFRKDTSIGTFTAEIRPMDEPGFYVDYYTPDGSLLKTEAHSGKTIHFMESYVQNTLSSIGVLNG